MNVHTPDKPLAFHLAKEINYEIIIIGHYDDETELWVNTETMSSSVAAPTGPTWVPAYTGGSPNTGPQPNQPDLTFDGWWPDADS